MAALTTTVIPRGSTGADPTASMATPSAGGDSFVADAETWLRVTNTTAGAITVTATPPAGGAPQGGTVAPFTFTVPATTGDRFFGPFPPNPYADQNGNVNLTYSATPTKVGPFKFTG